MVLVDVLKDTHLLEEVLRCHGQDGLVRGDELANAVGERFELKKGFVYLEF